MTIDPARSTPTPWRARVEPFTRPFFFAFSRWRRGMTLGVRGVATDAQGRVLLVRHTYLKGWWLPGGGVDKGETTQAAVVREMREETGLNATVRPRLISIHSNERFFPGDHVLVYAIDAYEIGERTSHGEIAEIAWFHPSALPEDVNRGTQARLAEIFGAAPISDDW
ncbi:NUDIX domain-containing protein [Brevundimonas sp.]|uniref:NUDIX domain-containing protein n=1 Tax=Brevundimonas sp. TaxID=1871086 RepID=UPI003BA86051